METKQNKTIKILLAIALMFTAFLIFGNTVHAKTKRSTYRTINGIYNSDGTIDTADGYCWKDHKGNQLAKPIRNEMGDRVLHRWKKANLVALLEDYELITA